MAIRNESTLRRWAAFRPGTRMPDSLEELTLSDQLALSSADVELHSLLSGTATAELELAALSNALDAAPTPQQRQQEANAAQVQAILDRNGGNPYGVQGYYQNPDDPNSYIAKRERNLTDSMLLESLDPQLAAQMELQANPPQQTGLTQDAANFVNQEAARLRTEAMNAAFGGGLG